MSGRSPNKPKQSGLTPEQRKLRNQRIVFVVVSVIIILSWVLSLAVNV